jgi:hypothetical protein
MYPWAAVMVEAGVQQLTVQAGAQDGEVIGHMAALITDLMVVTMLLQWSMHHQ